MREYDFYVLKTEDGEYTIYKTWDDVDKIVQSHWFKELYKDSPVHISGSFFGDTIAI